MRPLRSILNRVQRQAAAAMDASTAWTEEEEDALMIARKELGNNQWDAVGRRLRRPPRECRERYYSLKMGRTVGQWTTREEGALADAVKFLLRRACTEAMDDSDAGWDAVAKRMGTRRTGGMCRNKWMNVQRYRP
ncbi:hypothetical protein OF83DRAFT_1124527 [Amylostereum chailletii]|nr:hypothetical protein OF83DRAFT_1124527 [Amylostereum chailletii]